jgi:MFS family permease
MALVILVVLNLLNYVDRNLLAGAQPIIQGALHLKDARLGGLSSLFFVAYMFAAPLVGWLGDRLQRRILVPAAVMWWSCALGAATIARNFSWFPYAYMMVGVGEASFGVYAVAMLSDYFPHANRTRALSLFFLAMNCGRALGIPVGGWLAESFGWQMPFRIMAALGLLLGLLAVKFLFEPGSLARSRVEPNKKETPQKHALRSLLSRAYVCSVLGLAMENFAIGAITVWLPTYLYRYAGYTVGRAAGILGVVTLVFGIIGTWAGGVLGERFLLRDRRALYWISAASLLLAAPFVAITLAPAPRLVLIGIVGTQLFVFLNLGPLNTAILNSVPRSVRSTAIAVALFVIHALGDAVSPRLIGLISDVRGLRMALLTTVAALTLGGFVVLLGASGAPLQDQDIA